MSAINVPIGVFQWFWYVLKVYIETKRFIQSSLNYRIFKDLLTWTWKLCFYCVYLHSCIQNIDFVLIFCEAVSIKLNLNCVTCEKINEARKFRKYWQFYIGFLKNQEFKGRMKLWKKRGRGMWRKEVILGVEEIWQSLYVIFFAVDPF